LSKIILSASFLAFITNSNK